MAEFALVLFAASTRRRLRKFVDWDVMPSVGDQVAVAPRAVTFRHAVVASREFDDQGRAELHFIVSEETFDRYLELNHPGWKLLE